MPTLITQELSPAWSGAPLRLLNEQAAALLNQIHPIAGVQEAVVYDNHGRMLGAIAEGRLERAIYNQAGQYLAQVFAAFEQSQGKPKELELHFKRKEILARDLGNAFVAIACAPGADGALVRLAVNVAAAGFENDKALQESLRQAAPSRQDTLREVKPIASNTIAGSKPR